MERQGDLDSALKTYRTAIARLPKESTYRAELLLIAEDLEKRLRTQEEVKQLIAQAENWVRNEKWQDARKAYHAAIAQIPDSPQVENWRTALKRCENEIELARLFDAGLDALRRREWRIAQESL